MTLIHYSLFFQLVTGILPLIVLFNGKKKFNKGLIVFLSASVITTCILTITSILKLNNLVFFNLYQVISIVSLTFFYYESIFNKTLKYFIALFGLMSFSVLIFEISKTIFLDYSLVSRKISLVAFSIFLFFDYLISDYSNHKNSKSILLINTSLFVYNSSSFLFFIYISALMINNLWYIHNFIEGLSKLLIAYAFWKLPKTSSSQH